MGAGGGPDHLCPCSGEGQVALPLWDCITDRLGRQQRCHLLREAGAAPLPSAPPSGQAHTGRPGF